MQQSSVQGRHGVTEGMKSFASAETLERFGTNGEGSQDVVNM